MLGRIGTTLLIFFLALAILSISVLRSASVRYAFGTSPSPTPEAQNSADIEIDYELPYPGRVLPDHPAWTLKALRDKAWLLVTTNPTKKAEILLLFADKRATSARILFERGKSELGVATLTKAEKYLEQAYEQGRLAKEQGSQTGDFFAKLALASLKHQQVIEDILVLSPEEAKPIVTQTRDYSKRIFDETRGVLGQMGKEAPDDPFEK